MATFKRKRLPKVQPLRSDQLIRITIYPWTCSCFMLIEYASTEGVALVYRINGIATSYTRRLGEHFW